LFKEVFKDGGFGIEKRDGKKVKKYRLISNL